MKKNSLKIKNESGQEIDVRVLFTVEDAKTLKNYIVYTDDKVENNKIKTYVSTYELKADGIYELNPVKTKEEYDFVNKILNSLQSVKNTKEEEK